MGDRQRVLVGCAILGTVVVVIGVCVGAVGLVSSDSTRAAVPATVPPSATRPIIHTRTPTPTFTPTATPGPSPTATPTSTPTPTPTPTPIMHLIDVRALGRLETAEFVMQTVIDLEREPSDLWQEWFGTEKLLLIASGEVVAGFDLTAIKESDVLVQGKSVTLWLPQPEIFYSRVDNQKTFVYLRETGFLVSPDKDFETKARGLAEKALHEWALEHDILAKAEEFGKFYMESFLRSLGFTEIRIHVRHSLDQ